MKKLGIIINYNKETVTSALLKASVKPASFEGHIRLNIIDGEPSAPALYCEDGDD